MRLLTVLSFLLLQSLSFVHAHPYLNRRQSSDPGESSSTSSSPSSIFSSSSFSSSSITNPPLPSSPSISPSDSLSSSTPTGSSSESSSSSSSSSVVSSPSSSSSSSPSSVSSSTSSSTSSTITPSPNIGALTTTSYRVFTSTNTNGPISNTSVSPTPSGTGTGGSGFFANSAAVIGTFTVVGLVGLAAICGFIFFIIKRRKSRRDEEEVDAYFDKLPGAGDYHGGPSLTDLTIPATPDAYPPRDIHYGATNTFSGHGLEYPPDSVSVGSRPPSAAIGTAYAAAISQKGPYQYKGHRDNTAASTSNQQGYPPGSHPFADPKNVHGPPVNNEDAYDYDPFHSR